MSEATNTLTAMLYNFFKHPNFHCADDRWYFNFRMAGPERSSSKTAEWAKKAVIALGVVGELKFFWLNYQIFQMNVIITFSSKTQTVAKITE